MSVCWVGEEEVRSCRVEHVTYVSHACPTVDVLRAAIGVFSCCRTVLQSSLH